MNEIPSYAGIFYENQIIYPPHPLEIQSSSDVSWYLLDLYTGEPELENSEQADILIHTGSTISTHLGSLEIPISSISRIGRISSWYVIVELKSGEIYTYNLRNIADNFQNSENTEQNGEIVLMGNELEGTDLERIFRENNERYHLAWGNFHDHISAMHAIFEVNAHEGIFSGNGYLDENDKFDSSSSMSLSIINPDLITRFDGMELYEIQQLARQEYRNLIAMMNEYPIEVLSPDTRYAIAQSIDTYTRMIMGIGNLYKGGATHFDKSRAEVEYGIYFSINNLQTSEEVLYHWLEIRAEMNANNFQDTTIEQRAYPFYIQTLNRISYQKMIDLGASREELLRFARAVSGRNTVSGRSEWSYGPSHYEHEFANIILGNLIGMPQEENFNSRSEENGETAQGAGNLIEQLIGNGDMQNIEDNEVHESNNLSVLYQRASRVLNLIGESFPGYLNNNFFGGRQSSEILIGEYSNLQLSEKLTVSSVSRFITYVEESIGEYSSVGEYQESLRQNARNISNNFMRNSLGSIGVQSHHLHFDESLNKFILGVNPFSRGMIYIQVDIENIQSMGGAYHYLNSLSKIVRENQIIPGENSGIYTSLSHSEGNISWESLMSEIPSFSYGQAGDSIVPVHSGEMLPRGYIENLRIRSISESFDYISHEIMSRFDWGNGNGQLGRIRPEELNSEIFSDTDRNILELWTDINGLGGVFQWSDGNTEIAMQGAKIGLIIALGITASTLTAGVAAGGAATAISSSSFLRHSVNAVQTLNTTRRGSMLFGATMGFYVAPASWVVYPHGYSSQEEMILDLLSDLVISTGSGVIGGSLRPGALTTITDFTVLGIMTEAVRMGIVESIYHPGENFLDEQEL